LNAAGASTPGRGASETLQLGFSYPEVGAELARRWQLPKVILQAITYQAKPMQAPDNAPLPRIVAQAITVSDALESHSGATPEAQ
ncbi:HDOD domain-containing protein, partial [Robbsia andropogonis]|uniref:HDOD domain-containing protein n=1 Tax=Robbsia andropogonis TaxID=28092 RepID=UPI00209EBBE5